jgi:hypothetical protein
MAELLSKDSTVVVAKDQLTAELEGEAVILSLTSSSYYGLNSVGARIWSLLSEPRRVGEIRDTICREYKVEPDHCERDLFDLLGKMAEQKLIEVR